MTSWLWVIFTVLAAGGQTLRNAMQRELTTTLGTVGATHVRFLFGLPFALLFLATVLLVTGEPVPPLNARMLAWTIVGATTQFAATALLLAALREKSFVLITALVKTEPVHVAIFGLVFLGDHIGLPFVVADDLQRVPNFFVFRYLRSRQITLDGNTRLARRSVSRRAIVLERVIKPVTHLRFFFLITNQTSATNARAIAP